MNVVEYPYQGGIMKRRFATALGLLTLLPLVLGAAESLAPPVAQAPVLLWEPTWSPRVIEACLDNLWEDFLQSVSVWDMEGDGQPEILTVGAALTSLYNIDFSLMPKDVVYQDYAVHNDPSAPGGVRLLTRDISSTPHPVTVYPQGTEPAFLVPLWDEIVLWRVLPADLDANPATDLVILGDKGIWPAINPGTEPSVHPFWMVTPMEGAPFSSRTEGTFDMWFGDATWDGVQDVLLADNRAAALFLAPGTTDGRFEMPEQVAVGGCPVAVVWNEQGAWIETTDGLWLLPKGGSEPLQLSSEKGYSLAVADLDRDGIDEIAIGTGTGLSLFRQEIDGGVTKIRQFSDCGTVVWIAAGDINGDSFQDLAIGSYDRAGVWTFFGQRRLADLLPTWQGVPSESGLPVQPKEGLLADLNGDGRDELVGILKPSSVIVLSPSPCGRSAQALPGIALLCATDIDGDEHMDLLADDLAGGISVLMNVGAGRFEEQALIPARQTAGSVDTPFSALLVDVNGDGIDELAEWSISDTGGTVSLWSRGSETWAEEWHYRLDGPPIPILRSGDVDGDGFPEVIVAASDQVAILGGFGTPSRTYT
jgi:hypothetical protein